MTEHTVKDVRQATRTLEENIKGLLVGFSEEYEVGVEDIVLDQIRTLGNPDAPVDYMVRLRVSITNP